MSANVKTNPRKTWTEKENKNLIDAVKNKKDKSAKEIFKIYASKSGRTESNVSQHYYQMVKDQSAVKNSSSSTADKKAVKKSNTDMLIAQIKQMPDKMVRSLYQVVNYSSVK